MDPGWASNVPFLLCEKTAKTCLCPQSSWSRVTHGAISMNTWLWTRDGEGQTWCRRASFHNHHRDLNGLRITTLLQESWGKQTLQNYYRLGAVCEDRCGWGMKPLERLWIHKVSWFWSGFYHSDESISVHLFKRRKVSPRDFKNPSWPCCLWTCVSGGRTLQQEHVVPTTDSSPRIVTSSLQTLLLKGLPASPGCGRLANEPLTHRPVETLTKHNWCDW